MKKTFIGIALLLAAYLFQSGLSAFAAELDAGTVLDKMKAAFEPMEASTRTLNFFIKDHEKVTNTWVAREARNALPDGKKTLLVMIEPDDIKGFARLVSERQNESNLEWMYLPALKRTVKLTPVNAYDSFRGTDFTYSDIGFINVQGTHKFLGEEERKGTMAYKIETIPEDRSYYSRIVTWVSKENFLPLERDLYDVTGTLWKTQFFEEVTVINNIPPPLRIVMRDVQAKTSTGYKVSEVCYGAGLPDEIFQPKGLPNALQYDFCPLPKPNPGLGDS
jgi:outer membrane lipoprotein-sorting protein